MKFTIHVDEADKKELFACFEDILQNNFWSGGKYLAKFEEVFGAAVGAETVGASSWAGPALALLNYIDVKDAVVLVPSNTFMATPLAVIQAGGRVEFVDCNRHDLCMSVEDLARKIDLFRPKAVFLVHIGGHIAFDIFEIKALCDKKGVILIEDCAHAHGAEYHGQKAGTFGVAGVYSFYATKTLTSGEGGCLVSRDPRVAAFVRKFINYGKPDYKVPGLNFRMNEFTAAVAAWQAGKMPAIIRWKNEKAAEFDRIYKNRVVLPPGMISGYYKYIVFDRIENSTGKVYEEPCHRIMGRTDVLPNTDWVAGNHWCVPLYYKG